MVNLTLAIVWPQYTHTHTHTQAHTHTHTHTRTHIHMGDHTLIWVRSARLNLQLKKGKQHAFFVSIATLRRRSKGNRLIKTHFFAKICLFNLPKLKFLSTISLFFLASFHVGFVEQKMISNQFKSDQSAPLIDSFDKFQIRSFVSDLDACRICHFV